MNKEYENMAESGQPIVRSLTIVAGIVAVIIIVFLVQLTLETNREITSLRDELRESRDLPVASLAHDPFAPLDKNCTWCHSDRRFLSFHGSPDAIDDVVHRMAEKTHAEFTDAELRQIHGSMELLKCVKCHDHHTVELFAAYPKAKQEEIFDNMWRKPESGLTKEDGSKISSALHAIQGF